MAILLLKLIQSAPECRRSGPSHPNFLLFWVFGMFSFCYLVSISSNVVIQFTHPMLQFNILKPKGLCLYIVPTIPGESLYCTFIQSSLGPIWSNVLLIFLFQKAFYFHSIFLSLYVIGDNLFSFLIRDNQAQLEPGYLAWLFKRWIALSTG